MEFLAAITMLCSSKVDLDVKRPDCQAHFEKCINELYETPQVRAGGWSKDDIALKLASDVALRRKVCK